MRFLIEGVVWSCGEAAGDPIGGCSSGHLCLSRSRDFRIFSRAYGPRRVRFDAEVTVDGS